MAQKSPSVAVPVGGDKEEAPVVVPSNQRWKKKSSEEKSSEKCSPKTISLLKRKLEKSTGHNPKMKRLKTGSPSCQETISDSQYEESLQLEVDAGLEASPSTCCTGMKYQTVNKEHSMTSQLDHEKTHEDGPFHSCLGTSKTISNMMNLTDQRSKEATLPKLGGTSVIPPDRSCKTVAAVPPIEGEDSSLLPVNDQVLSDKGKEYRRQIDNVSNVSHSSVGSEVSIASSGQPEQFHLQQSDRSSSEASGVLHIPYERGKKETSPTLRDGNIPNFESLGIAADSDGRKALNRRLKAKKNK